MSDHKYEELYEEYCALIQKHFTSHGLTERKYGPSDDSNVSGRHCILKQSNGTNFLGIASVKNKCVMEIISEPWFAKGLLDCNLPTKGLAVEIIDKDYTNMILKFCEEYERLFDEKVKIKQ